MEKRTLLEYWLVLYQRRWLIIFTMLTSMAVAGVLSKTLTPVYEAKALCFIPQIPDVATLSLQTSEQSLARSPLMPVTVEDPHAPYIGILKSSSIAELTIEKFPHRRVHELKRSLDFILSNEYLLEIYARDNDPVKAAGICNAYMRNLDKIINKFSLLSVSKNQLILEQKVKSTKAELDKARKKLQKFQKKHNTAALGEETRQLISQKMNFQSKYEATEVEQKENEREIAALEVEFAKEMKFFEHSNLVITSPLLVNLREMLAEVEINLAALKVDLQDSHPDNVKLNESHKEINKNISNEIKKIIDSKIKAPDTFYEKTRQQLVGLFVEKERIMASLTAYMTVISKIDKKIQNIPEMDAQIDSLETEVVKYKTLLQILENNLEEVNIQRARDFQSVVVVDEATPPPNPAFPILWLNLLASAFFGFFIGVTYCLLLSYIERTKGERTAMLLRAIEKSREM